MQCSKSSCVRASDGESAWGILLRDDGVPIFWPLLAASPKLHSSAEGRAKLASLLAGTLLDVVLSSFILMKLFSFQHLLDLDQQLADDFENRAGLGRNQQADGKTSICFKSSITTSDPET